MRSEERLTCEAYTLQFECLLFVLQLQRGGVSDMAWTGTITHAARHSPVAAANGRQMPSRLFWIIGHPVTLGGKGTEGEPCDSWCCA